MKKVLVHELGVSSVGKLVGTWQAILAVIVGTVASIVATVGLISNNSYSVVADIFYSAGIVIFGLFIFPLIAFAFGWLYGALLALVFNIVISRSGGLEITTEDVK